METLRKTVEALIEEGNEVLKTAHHNREWGNYYVELRPFAKWRAGCVNLIRMLGDCASPWAPSFEEVVSYQAAANRMLGTLEAISDAIDNDLLIKVEDLVLAEAFDNLLGQADYLFSKNFYLAAGVLGRAVLEEHLRSWCDHKQCIPTKQRPTINDFNQSLYQNRHISKTVMKHVDAVADIGNNAAHNKPELKKDDVERLLRDVREFVAKYP